jgi:hypothetical protein
MTAHALSGGVLRRLRSVLLLLIVALLALASLAPAANAGEAAAEPACPQEMSEGEVGAAIAGLLAFAQQYRQGGAIPTQEQVEAQLSQLFHLVDYLLARADELSEPERAALLSQAEAALVSQGLPPEQVQAGLTTLRDLLNAEQKPTPEQAFEAIWAVVLPHLEQLVGKEQAAALHAFLLQFLPAHAPECPAPSPSPTPTNTAAPVANPTASASPSAPAAPAAGGLANTGIDPILLVGIVAIAMIAGGLALEAGQRRPARRGRR